MEKYAPFSPLVFAHESADAETRAVALELERAARAGPPAHTLAPQRHRELQESGEGLGGPVRLVDAAATRELALPDRSLPLRIFVPDEVRGVLFTIHGGGFVMGAAHHSDIRNWQIARHCKLAVVSPEYRLAPEAPHPAALDDCEAAALWLIEHAEREFGSKRILVGGESAGANLAVGTQLRLRDRHDYRFAGANLVFGWFDVGLTPSARRWGDRELVLSTPFLQEMARHYCGPAHYADPEVSPLHADLKGLSSAIFTVGTLDPLLDDTLFMYARWVAAGNPARLALYSGAVHGFTGIPSEIARRANRSIEQAMLEQLSGEAEKWQ